MSAADVVVIIVMFAFFLVGVMVGITVVYALSARKAARSHYRNRSEETRGANRRRRSDLSA